MIVTILYIVLCVLLFSLTIAIHEAGHFIAAVKLGLRVERFSIGFGPALWKKTIKGIEYRISAIPLGGYVSIPDIDPEGTKTIEGEKTGEKKARIPAWKEIVVAFAGPLMNIVLAAIVAVVLSFAKGATFGETSTIVMHVMEDTPAERAGLCAGDRIVAVGKHEVGTWGELMTEIQIAGEGETVLGVVRGEETLQLSVTPERDKITGACMIGIVSEPSKAAGWMTNRNPIKQLEWDAMAIFRVLKGLVTPSEMKTTGKALGGPVMIAEGIYNSVRRNIWDGLGFLRFLNMNLAVINLLPIPVLDGGLILFAFIALVFRRRLPEKFVNSLSYFFMIVLMGLMAILIFRDATRSWRIHTKPKDSLFNQPAIEEVEEE